MPNISKGELTKLRFLSLSNYQQLKTPFIFVDESGVLNDESNPFFLIGLIKTHRPQALYPLFRSIRSKYNYYAELKYNRLGMQNISIAKDMFDVMIESKLRSYSAIIIAKHEKEFEADLYFGNNLITIYRKFLILLLKGNISPIDIATVLTDDYFFPYNDNGTLETIEGSIRAIINDHFGRLALTGVCQLNSCLNDFIQLTDLISGCILLDLKFAKGHLNKNNLSSTKKIQLDLLDHMKQKIGMDTNESFFLKDGTFKKTYHNQYFGFKIDFLTRQKAHTKKAGHRHKWATPASTVSLYYIS